MRHDAIARMIDSSANRAKEGLRVLEDLARFGMDDRALAESAKHLRHALTTALNALPLDHADLLASRDTPNDIGTAVQSICEYDRPDLAALADANASRVTEALRTLEETSKALAAPDTARQIEHARYDAYELHRRLSLSLHAATAVIQPRVTLLLTQSLCTIHPWEHVLRAALEAGAEEIQIREKSLSDADLLTLAQRARAITREHAARLVINDRVDLALAAQADGVHLGQDDLPIRAARALAGSQLEIGATTPTLELARAAIQSGARVLGLGPMFHSTTRPDKPVAGPAYLATILADPLLANVSHRAIGGITPGNVAQLAAVGCKGVAVSACVCSSPDPAAVVRALRHALEPTRSTLAR
ncbi:MAG: thiamine phosphate synthase [Phycisphaerales bacterium]|nr:MAG: thiamine phosphate synthase [Phycisphaerales bacterium]